MRMLPSFLPSLAAVAVGMTAAPAFAGTADLQITAADVWVLPDFDPYQSGIFDWLDGNGVGQWSEGVANLGTTSLFVPDIQDFNNLGSYSDAGLRLCDDEIVDATDATCSHQLISGGSVDFTVMSGETPTDFSDAIAINRMAPDAFAGLGILGFSFSGADAAYFALDPNDFPETLGGSGTPFTLSFTGTESRGYAATLNLTTDTPGLTIPFEINGRVTTAIVPSPTAATAGFVLLGGLAMRRRRRTIVD